MEKSSDVGSGTAGKGKKKQKQPKSRKKANPAQIELNKSIRQLRNATTEYAIEIAVKRAQPYKSEIKRRAPVVAQKFDVLSSMRQAG